MKSAPIVASWFIVPALVVADSSVDQAQAGRRPLRSYSSSTPIELRHKPEHVV